jgi:transposase
MSRGYQALGIDGSAIVEAMNKAETLEEFKRYQSLHLRVNEGMPVVKIASVTSLAESTIHNLHSNCRKHGLEAIRPKRKGGRYRSYLSVEEEKALLRAMEPQAKRGGIVEVSKIHRALEEKVGGEVARNTVYRLLHRHGWRKIAPRPKHPKSDATAQEAFKKTGRILSPKPKKKPPR